MTTTAKAKDTIGKCAWIWADQQGGLQIEVEIVDHKVGWGRDRYLVTPLFPLVDGGEAPDREKNSKWVEEIWGVHPMSECRHLNR